MKGSGLVGMLPLRRQGLLRGAKGAAGGGSSVAKGDGFHIKKVDVHLGLYVYPLPDLQEVIEGDALVHLISLHLPHAVWGLAFQGTSKCPAWICSARAMGHAERRLCLFVFVNLCKTFEKSAT